MELHSLKPAKGSVKSGKRIARGQGSTRGGTSTRGHKGQKSRSGDSRKRHFEGGQMALQMRLPKRGFKNPTRVEYVALNLGRLEALAAKYNETNFDIEKLVELNVVRKTDRVKLLATGELNTALTISVHAASNSAKEAVEAKGGTVNLV